MLLLLRLLLHALVVFILLNLLLYWVARIGTTTGRVGKRVTHGKNEQRRSRKYTCRGQPARLLT